MFDFHNHYTNWKQAGSDFSGLMDAMDKAEVSRTVVCGLPTKQVEDRYAIDTETDTNLLGQYEKLSAEYQKRVFPFICGINPENPAAISYAEELIKEHKSSIFGIGEIICRHDAMSFKAFGKEIPPNTETMLKLSDLAAEHKLPILLHSNIAQPGDTEPRHLDELEEFFSHNPQTKIVWAHCGISKDINGIPAQLLLSTLETLFARHENLSVDLSWRVFDYYIDGAEKQWAKLISKYPERFLLGTDHTGKWQEYLETVRRYDKLILMLPEAAQEMVKFKNAEKLISL